MKKRYLYALLFLVPGVILSLIVASLALGATAGLLWIFVFGDNNWPSSAGTGLALLYGFTFTGFSIACVLSGYFVGKKLEADPALNKKHLFASFATTCLFLVIIILHQLSIGNIGPKHDSIICSEYCKEEGYSTSGMPPGNSGDDSCICYDSGHEAIKIPMGTLRTAKE